jgi:hypothetical protein
VECHVADAREYSVNHLDDGENRRKAFQDVMYEWVAMRMYTARGWVK